MESVKPPCDKGKNGGAEENRTLDLLNAIQVPSVCWSLLAFDSVSILLVLCLTDSLEFVTVCVLLIAI